MTAGKNRTFHGDLPNQRWLAGFSFVCLMFWLQLLSAELALRFEYNLYVLTILMNTLDLYRNET